MSEHEVVLYVNQYAQKELHPKLEALYAALGGGRYERYDFYKLELSLISGKEVRIRPATKDELAALRKGFIRAGN